MTISKNEIWENLGVQKTGLRHRMARKILFALTKNLPDGLKYQMNSTLKRMRQGNARKDFEISFENNKFVAEYLSFAKNNNICLRSNICLTHDVDYKEGYKFFPKLMEIEESFNIRSTFNFLTRGGYQLDKGVLMELHQAGFEVGLHGYNHDIALAYRHPSQIRRSLEKALSFIPFPVAGFRSPALSNSPVLFQVLDDLNFQYDSSIPSSNPYYPSTGFCYPYIFSGLRLKEIPLTLQDDTLFRDQRMTDHEALDFFKKKLMDVLSVQGTFVFNSHPIILKSHIEFYKETLEIIRQLLPGGCRLMRDVASENENTELK